MKDFNDSFFLKKPTQLVKLKTANKTQELKCKK